MEDQQIVALYWQRDETALTETAAKYQHYLTKIAFNILADHQDSEESVNDTYLKAWTSMPPHQPVRLAAYLSKITRQLSIDRFRKKHRQKRGGSQYERSLAELEDCVSAGDTTCAEVDLQLLSEAISRYLMGLAPKTRIAFIGRYYFLDSIQEIATYCGMSQAQTKSLLFRCRKNLYAFLKEEEWI